MTTAVFMGVYRTTTTQSTHIPHMHVPAAYCTYLCVTCSRRHTTFEDRVTLAIVLVDVLRM